MVEHNLKTRGQCVWVCGDSRGMPSFIVEQMEGVLMRTSPKGGDLSC